MRLSYFHMELAKRVARGETNREIKKEVQISDSRLSVIKKNPLFVKEVEKWKRIEDEKYAKAIEKVGGKVEKITEELINMVSDVTVPGKVRADLGNSLLDRLGNAEGRLERQSDETSGEEVTFEQILKVTKKTAGQRRDSIGDREFGVEEAFEELEKDSIEGEILDETTTIVEDEQSADDVVSDNVLSDNQSSDNQSSDTAKPAPSETLTKLFLNPLVGQNA